MRIGLACTVALLFGICISFVAYFLYAEWHDRNLPEQHLTAEIYGWSYQPGFQHPEQVSHLFVQDYNKPSYMIYVKMDGRHYAVDVSKRWYEAHVNEARTIDIYYRKGLLTHIDDYIVKD